MEIEQESYGKRLLTLGLVMFRIGCLTFGGGWSIIAQMEEAFAGKRGYATSEQLMDDLALGKSLPGIMIVNTVVIFGYQTAGVAGALVAAIALSLPALIAIAIVAYCYSSLRDNLYAARILSGVRCAVVPIILTAGLKLKATSLVSRPSWVIALLAFVLCGFTSFPKLLTVVLGGAAGWLLFGGRREEAEK